MVWGGNGSAAREFHHPRTVSPDHNRFLDLGLLPDVLMPVDKDLGTPEADIRVDSVEAGN